MLSVCVGDTVWLNDNDGPVNWDKGWTVTRIDVPAPQRPHEDPRPLRDWWELQKDGVTRTRFPGGLPWQIRVFPNETPPLPKSLEDYDVGELLLLVRSFDGFAIMCVDCEGLLRKEEVLSYEVGVTSNKVRISDKGDLADSYICCDCVNENLGSAPFRTYGIDTEDNDA